MGFGVVAQGVWMILDRCCIPRGATESPPWRLWVVRGLELFLTEALLFGTGAFYSPHSRLSWRRTQTTPGCRLRHKEYADFAAKRDFSRFLRAYPAGDPGSLLRSSIRMACSQRLRGLPAATAASQLSPNSQYCKGKRACLLQYFPGRQSGDSSRAVGVNPLETSGLFPWWMRVCGVGRWS